MRACTLGFLAFLACATAPLLGGPSRVQADDGEEKVIQPTLGFDDVGVAQYQDQKLRLQTFVWKVSESKHEKNIVKNTVQVRTKRKPQLNPETGKQEVVEFTYEVIVPVHVGMEEIVTKTKAARTSVVEEFNVRDYSVMNLDGKVLSSVEMEKELASPRSVFVMRVRYKGEPNPTFDDVFRGLVHPGALIVRVPERAQDGATPRTAKKP